jgi:FlaA1/EpsC-like NDP-sugar epimerase
VDRWQELLRKPDVDIPPAQVPTLTRRNVLVTGAGGYIGSALATAVASSHPAVLVLVDHSEENLHRISEQMQLCCATTSFVPLLGDVADASFINEVFQKHHPHAVFHAAAYKHVCLQETNPFAAISNNVLGTLILAQACLEYETAALVMISTDKAVNPSSVMGASKRIAELVLLSLSTAKTRMSALRFGNVFGSTGSVVPRFQQQISAGGPVTVTHRDATRYFLTLHEAVQLILAAASLAENGSMLIPQMLPPIKILDLANRLMHTHESAGQMEITFSGLRPGEKLTEEIMSSREALEPTANPLLYRVVTPQISRNNLEAALSHIAASVQERNLALLLDTVCSVVPEYTPSESVLGLLKTAWA